MFEPIGIGNPDWTLCPKGHVHAANGLYFNIDELGNFGQMLLQEGLVNGRQIVSAEYLREATADQVKCKGVNQEDKSFHGYGYQFWRSHISNTYMCNGNYGQYCMVIPEKETVISILSFKKEATLTGNLFLLYIRIFNYKFNPFSSAAPIIKFIHWTAAPEAPFPRLSKRVETTMRSSLPYTKTSMPS